MKNPFGYFRLLPFLLSAFFLSGCEPDCSKNPCQNGGVCSSGNCDCPRYYEGKACESLERDKFLRNYAITYRGYISDNSLTDPQQYRFDTTVYKSITPDAANNKVRLADFLGFTGSTMVLTVVENRLELKGGDYPFRRFDETVLLDVDHATGYLQGNQIIIRLQGAGLGLKYQLVDSEMILTQLP